MKWQNYLENTKVLVACSGGLDSTVLFHFLYEMSKAKKNFSLELCHVNFGLRGKESDEDEAFVRALAETYQVKIHVLKVNESQKLDRAGKSVQEWARDIRYMYFSQAQFEGMPIALGHHLNDVAETVLFRMARGSGVENLAGMDVLDPPFVRPLLEWSREKICEYAQIHKLSHREDSSNQLEKYDRNIVRHRILPEMEKLFPGAADRIGRQFLNHKRHFEYLQDRVYPESEVEVVKKDAENNNKKNSADVHLLFQPQVLDYPERVCYLIQAHIRKHVTSSQDLASSAQLERLADVVRGVASETEKKGRLIFSKAGMSIEALPGEIRMFKRPPPGYQRAEQHRKNRELDFKIYDDFASSQVKGPFWR